MRSRRLRRVGAISIAALAWVLVGVSPPPAASARPLLGIGEQNAEMFDHPAFDRLGIRTFRYFVPWNARTDPHALARADAFVDAAAERGGRVLMHLTTHDYRPRRARPPSVRAYRREARWLVERYRPRGVREWGAWNEANHATQPTWSSPRRSALYFREMWRACPGCRIVAVDVLDQRGAADYVDRFYRSLGGVFRRRARFVGIHNYIDVNRRGGDRHTRAIIRRARRHNRRAAFWLTETGGLVSRPNLRCDERRAAHRLRSALRVALRLRRAGVTRIYPYNWTGTDCSTTFDSGIVRADGSLRPGYRVLRSKARRFRR